MMQEDALTVAPTMSLANSRVKGLTTVVATPAPASKGLNAYPDTEQVQRAVTRDAAAFRAIMQTHNRCLYQIARSILRPRTRRARWPYVRRSRN